MCANSHIEKILLVSTLNKRVKFPCIMSSYISVFTSKYGICFWACHVV